MVDLTFFFFSLFIFVFILFLDLELEISVILYETVTNCHKSWSHDHVTQKDIKGSE